MLCVGYGADHLSAMAEGNTNFFKVLVREIRQDVQVNAVVDKELLILFKIKSLEPV